MPMEDSILTTVKKLLGLPAEYEAFDQDIITHINTTLVLLNQKGIGPKKVFQITGKDETWDQLSDSPGYNNTVKTYIYQRVRLMFDPPTSSLHVEALNKSIAELEWMLYTFSEENWEQPGGD